MEVGADPFFAREAAEQNRRVWARPKTILQRSSRTMRLESMIKTGRELSDTPVMLDVTSDAAREQVFQGLVDDRLEDSYRLASMLLGDPSEAEDATHDAVVTAWRAFRSLREASAFDAWFQRILVNTCRDRLRRRRRRPTVELLPELRDAPQAPDHAPASTEREALRGALLKVDADHRIVIVLRFYLDLPLDEIARRLDERPGTVRSRLHHALRSLRAAYEADARTSKEGPR